MQRIHLIETESTNTYARDLLKTSVPSNDALLIDTEYQTCGRGQTGNHWESKRGENLTFSILCHPKNIRADEQFLLSQVIALTMWNTLDDMIEGISIKWPNDIYWYDKKICGILIEYDLKGSQIANGIIGVGLNVNQENFESDAPNPVSLFQIIGFSIDKEKILNTITTYFHHYYQMLNDGKKAQLQEMYKSHLYRREGFYQFAEPNGNIIEAEIADVETNGYIILRTQTGETHKYEFKQIKWII
ncbi:MAG: biotin--[acetyl-CoA-carboxylase] ligase [Prevotellaceae bacterium]|nr:biotin--[acetyl-CoA-carboxylase] ligase [Candidatus Colivivens equi]